jgi:RNA polymerase sigma-70 factor, ECF subfamily
MEPAAPPSQTRERLLEQAFEAHYHDVLAYALRRLGGRRAQAEEVASDTFSVAWRRIERLPESDQLPWLYSIARRVVANELRGTRRRERLQSALTSFGARTPREPSDLVEARAAIVEAVQRLSAAQREVVLLVAWEGLSNREAAIALGCSTPAFELRLHRARRRLAKELARAGHTGMERDQRSEEPRSELT